MGTEERKMALTPERRNHTDGLQQEEERKDLRGTKTRDFKI